MNRTDWMKTIPSLEKIWIPYLQYDDKLNGSQAIGEGEPHFYLLVNDPYLRDNEHLTLCCTKEKVRVINELKDPKYGFYEEYDMTHASALKYLEQLPRSFYAFTESGKLDDFRNSLINQEKTDD